MPDEIKLDVIEKTQKILGKHIVKPPLTEKLLKKPPFRFLHDVVTSVITNTGFLKGLFSESELLSDNVKEREVKITFLTKLIDAVKSITEIQLKVKPTKIIAGLEPTETNKLLQALGTALDKKLDSSEYVRKLNSQNKTGEKVKKPSKTTTKDEKNKDSVRAKKTKPESTKAKEKESSSRGTNNNETKTQDKLKKKTKKDSDKRKVEQNKLSPKIEEKDSIQNVTSEKVPSQANINTEAGPKQANKNIDNSETNNKQIIENMVSEHDLEQKQEEKVVHKMENNIAEVSKETKITEENIQKKIRSDRPKSARPQSGDFKKIISNDMDKTEEVDVAPQKLNIPTRPMSSLRPPSVRPSSARPGAPRLKPDLALPLQEMVPLGKINVIVENYNVKETDEEETVVIQNVEIEPEPVQQILNIPEDKGHLVEQILEQIHDDDVVEHVKNKNDIDWENEGFRNRDATNREINQLRSQIQSLTKVANPFGKLMNYLHEDVESMLSELNMWMNMKREMYSEINNQKKINEESSKPLKLQLQDLEENIKKQQAEIVNIQSNILKNELRIKDLLVQ